MKLIVTLSPDETGTIVAECPAIPGCISQGATEAEALANIQEAILACLEARTAHGMPLTVEVREIELPVELPSSGAHTMFSRRGSIPFLL